MDVSSCSLNDFDDFSQPQELPGTTGAPWSNEEQQQLEQLLARNPPDSHSGPAERYIVVAASLPNKTARDVALRVKWMAMRTGKPGVDSSMQYVNHTQGGSHGPLRHSTSMPLTASSRPGSSGNLVGSLHGLHSPGLTANYTSMHHHHTSPDGPPMHHPSNSSGAGTTNSGQGSDEPANNFPTGGTSHLGNPGNMTLPNPAMSLPGPSPMTIAAPTPPPLPSSTPQSLNGSKESIRNLLNQNSSLLGSIKSNMEQCKVVENSELLARYRDNIVTVIQQMDGLTGIWQQMPPLPVQPNLEMAARVLPPPRPAGMPTSPMIGPLSPGGATMVGPTPPGMPLMPGCMMPMMGMGPLPGTPGMVPPGFPPFPGPVPFGTNPGFLPFPGGLPPMMPGSIPPGSGQGMQSTQGGAAPGQFPGAGMVPGPMGMMGPPMGPGGQFPGIMPGMMMPGMPGISTLQGMMAPSS